MGLTIVPDRALTPALLKGGRRDGERALNLAAVETVEEVNVIPATDSEVAGHVTVRVLAPEVDAAHVRAAAEHAREARTSALLAGFDHLNHLTALRVAQ